MGRFSSTLTIADKITKGRIVRPSQKGVTLIINRPNVHWPLGWSLPWCIQASPLASNSSTKMRSITD